ncbi:hypothetical protein L2E82_18327 [Cichorium intybus]|uniref:Uncharacterized protein n=1 Tax=Cichorium intybus TaxID=13427 RepID=A0ACB9FAT1_CICIN|nr:hypothetical protein L2E82_18327 [Cichorium intybus]
MIILENREFGRDTNRLDYFRVGSFDLREDYYHTEDASNGHGGGRRDGGVVVGLNLEQENGGGDMTREVPVGMFGDNGTREVCEMAVQSSEEEMGYGSGGVKNGGRLVAAGRQKKWWAWMVCGN